MPKRSNQFQRLAAVVHSRLTKGWEVEESKLLVDRVTGEPREVDVVAMAVVMSHQVVLSIECRDHARPADVTWVEAMHTKHQDLATSKLVLWSRSGFTSAALTKARFLSIDTVSARDAHEADWARFARSSLDSKVRLLVPSFTPKVWFLGGDGETCELQEPELAVWYDAAGQAVCAMPAIVRQLRDDPGFANMMLDHAPIGAGELWASVDPPEGESWFVFDDERVARLVQRISVGVSTSTEEFPMEAASVSYHSKVLTLATGMRAAGGRFELFAEEGPGSPARVVSNMDVIAPPLESPPGLD